MMSSSVWKRLRRVNGKEGGVVLYPRDGLPESENGTYVCQVAT